MPLVLVLEVPSLIQELLRHKTLGGAALDGTGGSRGASLSATANPAGKGLRGV